jgi:hypothetical protein
MSGEHRNKLRELFNLLKERGFAVADTTGKKHLKYKITAPTGEGFIWVLGTTPSDRRAWSNATQVLRGWLNQCGYSDERHYLRIATLKNTKVDFCEIYDIIDEIENITQSQKDTL